VIEAIFSDEFLKRSIRMALRTFTSDAFVVRIFVAGRTIIVSDLCKLCLNCDLLWSNFGAGLKDLVS
jgi:hypothetical protein